MISIINYIDDNEYIMYIYHQSHQLFYAPTGIVHDLFKTYQCKKIRWNQFHLIFHSNNISSKTTF